MIAGPMPKNDTGGSLFTLSLVLKGRARKHDEVMPLAGCRLGYPSTSAGSRSRRLNASLLSFQRPSPGLDSSETAKKNLRLAPEASFLNRIVSDTSRPWRLLFVEVRDVVHRLVQTAEAV